MYDCEWVVGLVPVLVEWDVLTLIGDCCLFLPDIHLVVAPLFIAFSLQPWVGSCQIRHDRSKFHPLNYKVHSKSVFQTTNKRQTRKYSDAVQNACLSLLSHRASYHRPTYSRVRLPKLFNIKKHKNKNSTV